MPQAFQGWYKHDIDAWQGSAAVQDMTDAEYRAFHNLIQAQFQQEDGMLPDDEKLLARLSRKRSEWPTIRESVLEQFARHESGRLFNPRQYREWQEAVELSSKRSRGGRATAEKRWGSRHNQDSDSTAIAQQPDSDSEASGVQAVNTLRNDTVRNETENIAQSATDRVRKPTSEELALVYHAYPRQVGRAKAIDAIGRAVARLAAGESLPPMEVPASLAYLRERATAYGRSPAGNAGDYTPYPTTWFNQERYFDDDKEWQRGTDGADRNGNRQGDGNRAGATSPAAARVADNRAKVAAAFSGGSREDSGRRDGAADGSQLFGAGDGRWPGRTVDAAMVGDRP